MRVLCATPNCGTEIARVLDGSERDWGPLLIRWRDTPRSLAFGPGWAPSEPRSDLWRRQKANKSRTAPAGNHPASLFASSAWRDAWTDSRLQGYRVDRLPVRAECPGCRGEFVLDG